MLCMALTAGLGTEDGQEWGEGGEDPTDTDPIGTGVVVSGLLIIKKKK
jgi:hypothetical protein